MKTLSFILFFLVSMGSFPDSKKELELSASLRKRNIDGFSTSNIDISMGRIDGSKPDLLSSDRIKNALKNPYSYLGGQETGNGGDRFESILFPWHLAKNEKENLRVCLIISDDFLFQGDQILIKNVIRSSYKNWLKLLGKRFPSPSSGHYYTDLDFRCEKSSISIYLGQNDKVKEYKAHYKNPMGLASLIHDDHENRKSIIWVGAFYNKERGKKEVWSYYDFFRIITHEWGHVFGIPHIKNTIMRKDITDYIERNKAPFYKNIYSHYSLFKYHTEIHEDLSQAIEFGNLLSPLSLCHNFKTEAVLKPKLDLLQNRHLKRFFIDIKCSDTGERSEILVNLFKYTEGKKKKLINKYIFPLDDLLLIDGQTIILSTIVNVEGGRARLSINKSDIPYFQLKIYSEKIFKRTGIELEVYDGPNLKQESFIGARRLR